MRRMNLILLVLGLTLAACDGKREPLGDSRGNATVRTSSSAVQELTGLTRLPLPEDPTELNAALQRHYPQELIGKRAKSAVLVDVSVDERGLVRNVAVVHRPPTAPATVRAVLVDADPRTGNTVEREFGAEYDEQFGPAAKRALSEVRFLPALRGTTAVPYTVRMTVQFTSPAR